jgi:hypothetical protein
MPSRKLMIGGSAALGGLFARLRRRAEPAPPPPPDPEPEDEPGDEVPAEEVLELREELRAELERLSRGGAPEPGADASGSQGAGKGAPEWADIKASRTSREGTAPPG